MAKLKFESAKGTKDWYGKETLVRNSIRDTLRNVFEKYGYDRLETPPLEKMKSLAHKGGGEIQKEVFQLSDQGGRNLALRFDQTVPLARYIASNPDLRFPFKRYAIGEVFRDGPTQPEQGRYRIFTQCDVDIVGVREMTAEAELLGLAQDAFEGLGMGEVEFKINNRKLLEGILDYAQIPQEARTRTIVTLDKLDKIGVQGVEEELRGLKLYDESRNLSNKTLQDIFSEKQGVEDCREEIISEVGMKGYQDIKDILVKGEDLDYADIFRNVADYNASGETILSKDNIERLLGIFNMGQSNEEIFSKLENIVTSQVGVEGLNEVQNLLNYSRALKFEEISLDPSLARGLDYYTGTTMEVYLKNKEECSSAILAGGRFDDMVGDFCGGQNLPAVGFSFGLERLAMIKGRDMNDKTVRQIYVVPIGNTQEGALGVCNQLRKNGLNVDMNLQKDLKVGKAIAYADKAGIPYVGFVGDSELGENNISLKDLENGEQRTLPISSVCDYIANKE